MKVKLPTLILVGKCVVKISRKHFYFFFWLANFWFNFPIFFKAIPVTVNSEYSSGVMEYLWDFQSSATPGSKFGAGNNFSPKNILHDCTSDFQHKKNGLRATLVLTLFCLIIFSNQLRYGEGPFLFQQ